MRDQPDNIKSINLIAETVEYLHLFKEDVNADNKELVIQILQTLVEFTSVSGCMTSQLKAMLCQTVGEAAL